MTSSKRIAALENRAFYDAKVLVMPAFDSRIKVSRPLATSFSNFMDLELSKELLHEPTNDPKFVEYVDSLKPFILTGGIMGGDTRIAELIYAVSKQSKFNLVATCPEDFIKGNSFLAIPDNIFCIGKQDWGRWLYLLKNSEAVWIYYSTSNNHFASHISPNKYWEAVLFNKIMLVNQISQFSDRMELEGPFVEVGEAVIQNLSEVFQSLEDDHTNQSDSLARDSRFMVLQNERTDTARQIIKWVFN